MCRSYKWVQSNLKNRRNGQMTTFQTAENFKMTTWVAFFKMSYLPYHWSFFLVISSPISIFQCSPFFLFSSFIFLSSLLSLISISFLLFLPPLFSTIFSLHPAPYLFSLFFSNVLLFLIVLFSFILPSSFLSSVFLLSLFIFLPFYLFLSLSLLPSLIYVWFSCHSVSSFLFLSSYPRSLIKTYDGYSFSWISNLMLARSTWNN